MWGTQGRFIGALSSTFANLHGGELWFGCFGGLLFAEEIVALTPPSPLSLFNHNSVTFGANPGLVQFLYDIHEGLSYPFLDVSQLFKFFAFHLSGYGNRLNAWVSCLVPI